MSFRQQPPNDQPNRFAEEPETDNDDFELIEEPIFQIVYDGLSADQRAMVNQSEKHLMAQALQAYKAALAAKQLKNLVVGIRATYVGVRIELEGIDVRVVGRVWEEDAQTFFKKQNTKFEGYLLKLQDGAAHRILAAAIANVDPPKIVEEKPMGGLFGWFKKEKVIYIERPRDVPATGSGDLLWPQDLDIDD